MAISIQTLLDADLPAAAQLFCSRYKQLRKQVPNLPDRYSQVEVILPMLQEILNAGPAAAAFSNGRMVGFMVGWMLGDYRGSPAAFSPEWANAVEIQDSRRIYEQLYTHLAAEWKIRGILTHLVSLMPDDKKGLETFHWLGFGMEAVDGLRDLQQLPTLPITVNIRRAQPADAATILELDLALHRHIAASPTHMPHKDWHNSDEYEELLADPLRAFWLAIQGDDTLAYLEIGPANEDACTIIYDEGTASILAAFTMESFRGSGFATTLLNRALEWAQAQGYVRCAVDFEPMNPLAAHFWGRYFKPVSYTLKRQLSLA